MSAREAESGSESEEELELDGEGAAQDDFGDWEEEEEDPTKCLFCEGVLPGAAAALDHCASAHRFDLRAIKRRQGLDEYAVIRIVNYVRRQVAAGRPAAEVVAEIDGAGAGGHAAARDDENLKPFLAEDPLLWGLEGDDDEPAPASVPGAPGPSSARAGPGSGAGEAEALRARVEELEAQLAAMRTFVQEAAFGDEGEEAAAAEAARGAEAGGDEGYFESYGRWQIHEEMLRDAVRTEAYRDFLYKNPDVVRDKVVLDVGCGTGILSMFATRAGARHVIGVDRSSIVETAREIVRRNGLEAKVTILRGRVEDLLPSLPMPVDVIISEWMGYFLLYESMLDTVIAARDALLPAERAAAGAIPSPPAVYPNACTMYIAALDVPERDDPVRYWRNVYGFDMSVVEGQAVLDADVDVYPPEYIISDPCPFIRLDMTTCGVADTLFRAPFTLTVQRAGALRAFLSYFDSHFDLRCPNAVHLRTGPEETPTHWKQTAFYVREEVRVEAGDVVWGEIAVSRNADYTRELEVALEWSLKGPDGSHRASASQRYHVR
eukprot:tig00001049_g6682.t1